MQQEQGEAGLGGDPGDARDRDVRTAGAVEELQVDVDRFAVAAEPDRRPCWSSGRSRAPCPARPRTRGSPEFRAAAGCSTPDRRGWWSPPPAPGRGRAARRRRSGRRRSRNSPPRAGPGPGSPHRRWTPRRSPARRARSAPRRRAADSCPARRPPGTPTEWSPQCRRPVPPAADRSTSARCSRRYRPPSVETCLQWSISADDGQVLTSGGCSGSSTAFAAGPIARSKTPSRTSSGVSRRTALRSASSTRVSGSSSRREVETIAWLRRT